MDGFFYNEENGFLVWIEGVSASKEENMSLAKDNTMVSVGKVGAAVGLKGETKVRLYAGFAIFAAFEAAILMRIRQRRRDR